LPGEGGRNGSALSTGSDGSQRKGTREYDGGSALPGTKFYRETSAGKVMLLVEIKLSADRGQEENVRNLRSNGEIPRKIIEGTQVKGGSHRTNS